MTRSAIGLLTDMADSRRAVADCLSPQNAI